jgi:uncharacterized membrane protein YfcA
MTELDYIVIVLAYTVAGSIKGLTGIGFSTSCLPIMALRLDLKIAIPLVIIPSIVSNVAVMVQAGRFGEAIKRYYPMYLASIPGVFLGLYYLAVVQISFAKVALGIVLIVYSAWALICHSASLPDKWQKILKVPVGFCTGFINGLTGSQVMPVLPFLISQNLDKNLFVQAMNISFTLASLILLVSMNKLGFLPPSTFLLALAGLIPVLTTVYIGGKIQKHLSIGIYKRIVLCFLLTMGVILLVKPFII